MTAALQLNAGVRGRSGGRTAVVAAAVFLAASPASARAQGAGGLPETVAPFVAVRAPIVALAHVTVVDGTGAEPGRDWTVVLDGGRIAAAGPSGEVRIPDGAEVLDLRGHTVIPGLVGLHDHTFYTTAGRVVQLDFSAPRLYLASGVTTIRTTGSYCPYCELNLRRDVESGATPGPRMHVTGPYVTGPGGAGMDVALTSPEQARRVVSYWADEGVTWFKAYAHIRRAELGAVIDEAHRRGLRVTGHLCSVSFREAVDLGIDNLEHGLFTNSDWVRREPDRCPEDLEVQLAKVDVESEEVAETIRAMVERGVALTSTLPVYELVVPGRPMDERIRRLLAPEVLEDVRASRAAVQGAAEGQGAVWSALFEKARAFELAFHRAGGLLAAGVDPTGIGGALPGLGDQRGFELLVEAGFTPVEAVRIVTLNGARVLGEEALYGSIEPGKLAEVVVLAGDLTEDPSRIRSVRYVFREGLGYDAAKLLESVEGKVGRS